MTASATRTASETEVETETETETETRDEPTLPYGIDEDGVSGGLYTTCKQALRGASFRTTYTKVHAGRATRKWNKQFAVDGSTAIGEWTRRDGGPVEMYRDRSESLWREDLGDRYTYGKDSGSFDLEKVVWKKEIYPLLTGVNWGPPERVNDARPAVWRTTADGVAGSTDAPGYSDGELRSVDSAALRVDEDGVIRSLDVTYESYLDVQDRVVPYRYRQRIAELGGVSVGEPDWLSNAEESRPRVDATLTDDRRFVRVEVTDGGWMATGSRLSVFDVSRDDTKFIANAKEPVEVGDVVYVYRMEDRSGFQQGRLAHGGQPADVNPPPLDGEYELSGFRQDSNYFTRVDVPAPD